MRQPIVMHAKQTQKFKPIQTTLDANKHAQTRNSMKSPAITVICHTVFCDLSYLQIGCTAFERTTFIRLSQFQPPECLNKTVNATAAHQLCPCF